MTRATKWMAVATIAILTAAVAPAVAEIVDQGQPGDQGPWPVVTGASGTSSSISSLTASSAAPTKTTTSLTGSGVACTAPGGASCTVILASTEVINWPNVAITIHNTGANTVDNVIIEWSPDGATWSTWDNTTMASLPTTDGLDMRDMQITGNSRRYIRIEARAAANTSVDVWLTVSR